MKNFLMALLLLASTASFGAAPTCTVTNSTACTVYYRIVLSAVNNSPACSVGAVSAVIALPPFGSVTYNAGTVPGVAPAARYFLGAIVMSGPPNCAAPINQIGDPCMYASLSAMVAMRDATCGFCSNITATWTASVSLGTPTSLTFM